MYAGLLFAAWVAFLFGGFVKQFLGFGFCELLRIGVFWHFGILFAICHIGAEAAVQHFDGAKIGDVFFSLRL